MFSLAPRCWSERGSQKPTATSVATLRSACAAISFPLFHVNDRRNCSGSSTIFYAIA